MQERCNYFVEESKNKDGDRWLLNNLLGFLQVYKERVQRKEITGATLRNYVKTIKLFCDMSDIPIPWKKITRGFPSGKKYTLEEIRKLVEYPDRRIKAIVYTMASSGIRVGAWDYLQLGHIRPLERDGEICSLLWNFYTKRGRRVSQKYSLQDDMLALLLPPCYELYDFLQPSVLLSFFSEGGN